MIACCIFLQDKVFCAVTSFLMTQRRGSEGESISFHHQSYRHKCNFQETGRKRPERFSSQRDPSSTNRTHRRCSSTSIAWNYRSHSDNFYTQARNLYLQKELLLVHDESHFGIYYGENNILRIDLSVVCRMKITC